MHAHGCTPMTEEPTSRKRKWSIPENAVSAHPNTDIPIVALTEHCRDGGARCQACAGLVWVCPQCNDTWTAGNDLVFGSTLVERCLKCLNYPEDKKKIPCQHLRDYMEKGGWKMHKRTTLMQCPALGLAIHEESQTCSVQTDLNDGNNYKIRPSCCGVMETGNYRAVNDHLIRRHEAVVVSANCRRWLAITYQNREVDTSLENFHRTSACDGHRWFKPYKPRILTLGVGGNVMIQGVCIMADTDGKATSSNGYPQDTMHIFWPVYIGPEDEAECVECHLECWLPEIRTAPSKVKCKTLDVFKCMVARTCDTPAMALTPRNLEYVVGRRALEIPDILVKRQGKVTLIVKIDVEKTLPSTIPAMVVETCLDRA